MDNLPDLPFEQVLSYLSLEDLLKSRAISRAWRNVIDNFRVKNLCYSELPKEQILGKKRWISNTFAQNFINSNRFECFFGTFSRSILSNVKHLRFCDIGLNEKNKTSFARTVNSFHQLEVLDMIRCHFANRFIKIKWKLSLPLVRSIYIEDYQIDQLTLVAPRLKKLTLHKCHIENEIELVHTESVERLTLDELEQMTTKHLKNLKYLKNLKQLYVRGSYSTNPALPFNLESLKEIHLGFGFFVHTIFEEKDEYNRADLKIYVFGILVNRPEDLRMFLDIPGFDAATHVFDLWTENQSRLADEMLFCSPIYYSSFMRVEPELWINLVKRVISFDEVYVDELVQDIPRFLDFLKTFDKSIVVLHFECDQPQDLFDRLAEHCSVQKLTIYHASPDVQFLLQLKHLVELRANITLDGEFIRKIFEELKFISWLSFRCGDETVKIKINLKPSKTFSVWINEQCAKFSDPNAVIQFIERPRLEG